MSNINKRRLIISLQENSDKALIVVEHRRASDVHIEFRQVVSKYTVSRVLSRVMKRRGIGHSNIFLDTSVTEEEFERMKLGRVIPLKYIQGVDNGG